MRGSDWQDMGESCTQKAVLLAIGWTGGGSLSTCGGECADLKIFRRDVRIVCSCAARGVCCIMLTAVDRLNCRCGFDGAPLLGGGFNLRRVLAPGLRSPFVTTSFSLFPRSTQKKVGRKKAGYLAPVLFDWIYQQIYLACPVDESWSQESWSQESQVGRRARSAPVREHQRRERRNRGATAD
jgi:hypothetical protein